MLGPGARVRGEREAPLQVIRGFGESEFDNEGRYLEYRYKNLSVISLYVPSGSSSSSDGCEGRT